MATLVYTETVNRRVRHAPGFITHSHGLIALPVEAVLAFSGETLSKEFLKDLGKVFFLVVLRHELAFLFSSADHGRQHCIDMTKMSYEIHLTKTGKVRTAKREEKVQEMQVIKHLTVTSVHMCTVA